VALRASSVLDASSNPILKLQQWLRSKKIAEDMRTILQHVENFYVDEKKLYGIAVKEEAVKDSTLISTFKNTRRYPEVDTIYALVDELEAYINRFDAEKTGLPMLNVTRQTDSSYLTRLALPVNRQLPNDGNIQYRRLLYNGKILVTEVKGGPASVAMAIDELENFVSDHQKVAPAIPFQSLITDRRKEPDTTKWVTKIYWPVM
jgi:hypothetical protein